MDFMIGVCEDDWAERLRIHEEQKKEEVLHGASIVRYIGGAEAVRHGGLRRMMRAIFASGGKEDMQEFGEVWRGETSVVSKKVLDEQDVERGRVNLEEGEWGDWFGESDEDVDDLAQAEDVGVKIKIENTGATTKTTRRTSGKRKRTSTIDADSTTDDRIYNPTTLPFRQRITTLLFKIASTLPSHFTTHDALLDTLEEYLRALPLPFFAAFIAPSPAPQSSLNPPSSHISLLQQIARPLLAGSGAPVPKNWHLTQEVLQSSYLPFASPKSSGVDAVLDNVRLALCCEGMLRLLWGVPGALRMHAGDGSKKAGTKKRKSVADEASSLRVAVERGIEARRSVVEKVLSKKSSVREDLKEALAWFDSTEMRLCGLLVMIEQTM